MVDGRWVRDQATSFELETSPLLKWGTSVCFVLGATIVLSTIARPFGVAFVVVAIVILAGLVLGARALFSSATIDDAGIQIRNLRHPGVIANWDDVQEVQITWGWAKCRVAFADGSRCRIWACTSPMTWQALIDATKWLETYDSPLQLKSHRMRQVTFAKTASSGALHPKRADRDSK